MPITYVVSTMVFRWRERPLSFEQECEYLKSLGFGVELWPTVRGQTGCRYEHDVIGSLEMCPCTPGAMIRRASEFLFDTLTWPNPPAGQPGYADTTYNPA